MNFLSESSPLSSAGESPRPDEPKNILFADQYPLRILIADDSYIARRVLFLLLQGLGYGPTTTENSRDCLNTAFQDAYDLLLIDLDMPGMSGIECAQSLREAGMKFPIVGVSGSRPAPTQPATHLNGFLGKPVSLAELKQLLREAARQKPATKASTTGQNAPPNDEPSDAHATVRIAMPTRRTGT